MLFWKYGAIVCSLGVMLTMTAFGTEEIRNPGLNGNLPESYESMKNEMTFPMSWASGRYSDFSAWKKEARAKVMEKLVVEPPTVALDTKTLEEVDCGDYFARKLAFNISDVSRVPALALIPKGKGPFPAVLLLHDHGSKFDIGKEKMIAPWGNPTLEQSAKAWSEKYFSGRFIGNELVKRGYVVLSVDALGWGERGRISYADQQALASNLYHLGSSLAGIMAMDDIRSAELLASLPEVNSQKVAALGFSMGAYRAWQVAALSDDIQAGVAVCWLSTIKGLMVPGNNTLRGQSAYYMVHPGLMKYLDYPDVAGLAAPKPMLFYNGGKDNLFPQAAVREAYDKMAGIWGSQQASDKLQTKIWPELSHIFVQEQQDEAFAWLDLQMK